MLRRYAVVGLVAVLVGGYVALHQSPSGASAGRFAGTTPQGRPISFAVTSSSVNSIIFTWQAVCADGQRHTNTIVLGSAVLAGVVLRQQCHRWGRANFGAVPDLCEV